MSHSVVKLHNLTEEVNRELLLSRYEVANQKPKFIKCPYCLHNSIIVFDDTCGHIQTKCTRCKMETVFNIPRARTMFIPQ